MMSKRAEPSILADKNLKRAFANAVRDIYQAGLTGQPSRYRSPIFQRAKNVPSHSNDEKKAVSDAASALAQLWRVSTNSSR